MIPLNSTLSPDSVRAMIVRSGAHRMRAFPLTTCLLSSISTATRLPQSPLKIVVPHLVTPLRGELVKLRCQVGLIRRQVL